MQSWCKLSATGTLIYSIHYHILRDKRTWVVYSRLSYAESFCTTLYLAQLSKIGIVPHYNQRSKFLRWQVFLRLVYINKQDVELTQLRITHSQSFNSLAIFEAIFLKPIDVPDIRLKRTPFNDKRGSLHTSISHCTNESVFGSPCTHSSKKRSRCS